MSPPHTPVVEPHSCRGVTHEVDNRASPPGRPRTVTSGQHPVGDRNSFRTTNTIIIQLLRLHSTFNLARDIGMQKLQSGLQFTAKHQGCGRCSSRTASGGMLLHQPVSYPQRLGGLLNSTLHFPHVPLRKTVTRRMMRCRRDVSDAVPLDEPLEVLSCEGWSVVRSGKTTVSGSPNLVQSALNLSTVIDEV